MKNELVSEKNRLVFIDVARGISILLMIMGHVLKPGLERSIIFSFHMPLFIIVSGFFYKERPIKEEIKKLLTNLLLPTTIILLITFFVKNITNLGIIKTCMEALKVITICWYQKAKIDYNFSDTGVLWFIYTLIIVRILFKVNKKITKENEIFLFIAVLFETYIGYLIGIKNYWLPWCFDITLSCMLFYYVGYIINKYTILEKICKDYKIIIVILIIWILGINYNCIELAVRKYTNGLWSYVTAIAGTIIIFKISMIIESKFIHVTEILKWCGKNSLYILFGHHVEWLLINLNFMMKNKYLYVLFLTFYKCIFSVIFTYLILKIKKFLIKNKAENINCI